MVVLKSKNMFRISKEDEDVVGSVPVEQQVSNIEGSEVLDNTELVTAENEVNQDLEKLDAVVDTGQEIVELKEKNEEKLQTSPQEITQADVIATEKDMSYLIGKLHGLGMNIQPNKFVNVGLEAANAAPIQAFEIQQEGIGQTIKEFFAKIWNFIKDIVSKIYQFIKVKILRIKPKEKEVAQIPPKFSDRVKTKLKSPANTRKKPLSKESFNINLESEESDRGFQRLNIPYILSAAYNENIDADDLIKFLQIAPSADVVIEGDKIIAEFIKNDNFNIDKLESVLHHSISGIQGAINTKFNKGILNCLDTSTITLMTNIPEALKEMNAVEVNTSSIPNEAVFIGLSGIDSGEYMTANSVGYKARFKRLPQNNVLSVIEAFTKSDAFGKLVAKADRMVFSKALELNMKSMEKLEKNIDKVAQVMERQFKAVVGEPDPEKAKYMHAIGTVFKEVTLSNIKFSKNQIMFISQLLDFILLVNRKYAE